MKKLVNIPTIKINAPKEAISCERSLFSEASSTFTLMLSRIHRWLTLHRVLSSLSVFWWKGRTLERAPTTTKPRLERLCPAKPSVFPPMGCWPIAVIGLPRMLQIAVSHLWSHWSGISPEREIESLIQMAAFPKGMLFCVYQVGLL